VQFADHNSVAEFSKHVDAVWRFGYGLVIVDTYSKCNQEGSENESAQTTRWLAGLDRLRAPALILHHPGRSGNNPRGSNALESAASVVIRVDRKGDLVTFTWER
jgi:hypothetical protein